MSHLRETWLVYIRHIWETWNCRHKTSHVLWQVKTWLTTCLHTSLLRVMCHDTSWHDTRLVYIRHIWKRYDLSTHVTSERHRVMCCDTSKHDTRLVYIRHIWETWNCRHETSHASWQFKRHDTRLVYMSHVLERHDLSTSVTSERHETVDTRRVMCHVKSRLVYTCHILKRHDKSHVRETWNCQHETSHESCQVKTWLHTSHLKETWQVYTSHMRDTLMPGREFRSLFIEFRSLLRECRALLRECRSPLGECDYISHMRRSGRHEEERRFYERATVLGECRSL